MLIDLPLGAPRENHLRPRQELLVLSREMGQELAPECFEIWEQLGTIS